MRILLVFRAPVGGLFRHVCDLAQAQSQLGHDIGIVCDASSGGEAATKHLKELEQYCSLGIFRIEMSRLPGIGDAISARRVAEIGKTMDLDIVHGHGAKGGVYARISGARMNAKVIYTAHGGALHYSWNSPSGALFLGAERMLLPRTDGLVFVCKYEQDTFDEKIKIGETAHKVVHNGLWESEFTPARLVDEPTDVLFIGELRHLKGVDVLIRALAMIHGKTATIVGDGPDREAFEDLANELNISERIHFTGAMPASEAFGLGKVMVIPSRAESFPYIVLEAVAAHKPLIASNVGGIGEILPPGSMIKPDDVDVLAAKLSELFADPDRASDTAKELAKHLKTHKSTLRMAEEICAFYQECLGNLASCSTAA